MPFRFPFMPFGYNHYNYYNKKNFNSFPNLYTNSHSTFNTSFGQNINNISENIINTTQNKTEPSKENCSFEDSEYFFEIFGIRLHFDDVLIICILFFLYTEEVRDYELFLCLILLLIS